MKISILCSSKDHPINEWLINWLKLNRKTHVVDLLRDKKDLKGGDLLFLVSCSQLIEASYRCLYKKTLTIHASDLPRGRGWSPHIWQVLDGETEIAVTLFEAEDKIDSGKIWSKKIVHIPKNALYNEINEILFNAEIFLMDYAVSSFDNVRPVNQSNEITPTYYPKRTPLDSKINPEKSIVDQFDLIRVCDPNRFPAFFELYGSRYKLFVEKVKDETIDNN